MKFKKLLLFFLVIALFSSIAPAARIYEVDNLKPTITVEYDESVKIISVSLKDANFNEIALIGDVPPIDYKPAGYEFNYYPATLLEEKNYFFTIEAEDTLGNRRAQEFEFLIRLLPVKIKLVEPQHGYSPVMTYDVIIETNRDVAECRYSKRSGEGDVSFESMDYTFEKITDTRLKIEDFTGPETIYVRCKDSYEKIDAVSTVFDLVVDQTPPVITSYYADPSLIVEEISGDLRTTLRVAADEATVCKYSDTDINYNDINFLASNLHEGFFEGNNESVKNSFKISNQRLLGSYLGERLTEEEHSYNVVCRNLAGLISETKTISFSVDLAYPLIINIISPPEATNKTRFPLNITTNKNSQCLYGEAAPANSFSYSNGYTHTQDIGPFAEGSYTYKTRCTHAGKSAEKTVNFKIDLTVPSRPVINAQNYTCPDANGLHDASASWTAQDNISGINYYYFAVGSTSGGTEINEWERAGTSGNVYGLNTTALKIYWAVKAFDKAGNAGQIGVNATSILTASAEQCRAPETCTDTQKNQDETDIDCGGTKCIKCSLDKTCNSNSDCISDLCDYDTARGAKVCKSKSHCLNNVTDTGLGETDIDCGGDCQQCGLGQKCESDSDCKTRYCKDRVCVNPSCTDRAKNGYETDTDCGGPVCTACEKGERCEENTDCTTRRCDNGICLAASCDDRINDGNETGVDCGGSCPPCANGQPCLRDNDCASGFCVAGICGTEIQRDSDKDGMPDSWENQYSCANLNALEESDASVDSDGDGLTNLEEFQYGTNPCIVDTDSDGYPDGKEVLLGYDPKNPDSHPKSPLLLIIIILAGVVVAGILGYFVGYPKLLKYLQKKRPKPMLTRPALERPIISAPAQLSEKDEAGHKRFLERMRQKEEERRRIFESFGPKKKAEEILKKIGKKQPEVIKKARERKKEEWLPFSKIEGLLSGRPKKTVFDRLEDISKERGQAKKPSKKTFEELEKIKKPEKKPEKALEELAEMAAKKPKKRPKEKAFKKPAKAKSKKTKKKRAQGTEKIFIYVLSLIIISLIIIYGYNAVRGFLLQGEKVTLLQSKSEIQTAVEETSSDYGTVKEITARIPGKFTKLCFIDVNFAAALLNICNPAENDYNPIICDSWSSETNDNVFFVESKTSVEPFSVDTTITVDGNEDGGIDESSCTDNTCFYTCIETVRGQAKFWLKGLGDRAIVSKATPS